jgi:hypothetical protein
MNKHRLAMGMALASAAMWVAQACSLGEGKTPDCDPDAPHGSGTSCLQLHQCDDGHGGIAAGNEACCLRRASYEFARCADVEEPDDFRLECVDIPSDLDCKKPKAERDPRCCCGTAESIFDLCMTQGLTTSATTSTGGAGGGGGGGAGVGGGGGN